MLDFKVIGENKPISYLDAGRWTSVTALTAVCGRLGCCMAALTDDTSRDWWFMDRGTDL